jgi:hypothetical protein
MSLDLEWSLSHRQGLATISDAIASRRSDRAHLDVRHPAVPRPAGQGIAERGEVHPKLVQGPAVLPVRLRRLDLHHGREGDARSAHADDCAAHRIDRDLIGCHARIRLDMLRALNAEAERAEAVALNVSQVRRS